MQWNKEFIYPDEYEYVSTNQHGDRYKLVGHKQVAVAVLTAEYNDADDLRRLILLSHTLGVPVHYDYKSTPQTAYIKVVAKEACV